MYINLNIYSSLAFENLLTILPVLCQSAKKKKKVKALVEKSKQKVQTLSVVEGED